MQNRFALLLAAGALSFTASACGGSQSSSGSGASAGTTTEQAVEDLAAVRFAHFADAPAVAVSLAGDSIADRFNPGTISDRVGAPVGSHPFVLSQPSGSDQFLSTRVSFASPSLFTVLVLGSASQNTLRALVLEESDDEIQAGAGAVRFVNGASGSGALSFASDGRGFAPNIAFGSASGYVAVPAGGTRFQVTGGMEGDLGVNVQAGHAYTIVAHTNNGELVISVLTETF